MPSKAPRTAMYAYTMRHESRLVRLGLFFLEAMDQHDAMCPAQLTKRIMEKNHACNINYLVGGASGIMMPYDRLQSFCTHTDR